MRWKLEQTRAPAATAPPVPAPSVAPDLHFINRNAVARTAMTPALTWIGHATMLVQADGLNVLTDPVFSQRASPVQFAGPRRSQPPGLDIGTLPRIDVVVISHNHYDHLDRDSVIALAHQKEGAPLFLVPLGLRAWMEREGIVDVVELEWWDRYTYQGVDFYLTPVQHWSGRTGIDRAKTLWGGWAVIGATLHWYFAGDTGYSKDFVDTRLHFAEQQTPALGGGFDLALIPIGAYEPRWFMNDQHVNPEEAVRIHLDLNAKRSVGVHWGVFALADEPLDRPVKALHVAREQHGVREEDFSVMAVGATIRLPPRREGSGASDAPR